MAVDHGLIKENKASTMQQQRAVKEGLLYHQKFVYEGEYINDYVPHGNGVCFYATGEVLIGNGKLMVREVQKRIPTWRCTSIHS